MIFKVMGLLMSSRENIWMKTKNEVLKSAKISNLTAEEETAKEAEERPGIQKGK